MTAPLSINLNHNWTTLLSRKSIAVPIVSVIASRTILNLSYTSCVLIGALTWTIIKCFEFKTEYNKWKSALQLNPLLHIKALNQHVINIFPLPLTS